MIIEKEQFAFNQLLFADICIIGGGPAAISMALSLSKTNLKVILVPGGGWHESKADRDLYKGIVNPANSHEPLEKMRKRQFGGSSCVWAGRCVPLDPIDFISRPWIKDSKWPIKYEDLLPYYSQAAEICEIGRFDFDANVAFPSEQKEIIEGFDSEEIVSNRLERFSPLLNFAKKYKKALNDSLNIKVLLDAHLLAFHMKDGNNKITDATVSIGKAKTNISASYFILATGGIENARLLLASTNEYFPTGIGNQNDNVGRYYMTHITGAYAKINPIDRDSILFNFEKGKDKVFCRRRWWIPESIQENKKMLNTIFYISHLNSLDAQSSILFSLLYKLAKGMVDKTRLRQFMKKIVNKKEAIPLSFWAIYKLGFPAILPSKNSKYWALFFSSEQMPNRESRVKLSKTEKDAFGMPRAEVNISFQEKDIESLVTAHNIFAKRFKEINAGEILYTEEGFREFIKKKINHYNSYAHHIGTTRMSDNPKTGVVDNNAKVFGVNNLFVAGSSTFTTSGHANPTLTIIAQALRLAEHLKFLAQKNQLEKTNHPVSTTYKSKTG